MTFSCAICPWTTETTIPCFVFNELARGPADQNWTDAGFILAKAETVSNNIMASISCKPLECVLKISKERQNIYFDSSVDKKKHFAKLRILDKILIYEYIFTATKASAKH